MKEIPDFKISKTDTSQYYKTPEGKVLSFLPSAKHVQIFESEEIFIQLVKMIKQKAKGKIHILEFYKEKVDKIEKIIPSQRAELSHLLNIDLTKLDYSPQSLKKINTAIKNNNILPNIFFDNIYFPTVVYLGETIRVNNSGVWVVKQEEKFSEIYIQLPDKRLINVFCDLWDEANEHYKSFSIFFIYERLLKNLRL